MDNFNLIEDAFATFRKSGSVYACDTEDQAELIADILRGLKCDVKVEPYQGSYLIRLFD